MRPPYSPSGEGPETAENVTYQRSPWPEFRVWLQHLLLGCVIFAPFMFLGCWAVGSLVRSDHIGWAFAVGVPSLLWDTAFLWWLTDARTYRPAASAVEGWTWRDGCVDAVCSVVGCCTFIRWLQPWGYRHVCNPWLTRQSLLPRWMHRVFARACGYFWLPCNGCGRMYGGHEWDGSSVHLPGDPPSVGRGICRACSEAGEQRG